MKKDSLKLSIKLITFMTIIHIALLAFVLFVVLGCSSAPLPPVIDMEECYSWNLDLHGEKSFLGGKWYYTRWRDCRAKDGTYYREFRLIAVDETDVVGGNWR